MNYYSPELDEPVLFDSVETWAEVERVLQVALKNDRTNPGILSLLGDAALRFGRHADASTYYQLAIQIYRAQLDGLLQMAPGERTRISSLVDALAQKEAACARLRNARGGRSIRLSSEASTKAVVAAVRNDPLLKVRFVGLNVDRDSYVAAAKAFLEQHGLVGERITVHASGLHADSVLREFARSELARDIVAMTHRAVGEVDPAGLPRYAGLATQGNARPRVTFIHVSGDDDPSGDIRSSIVSNRLKSYGYDFEGPYAVVLLNRALPPVTVAEASHPYPVVLVTTPYAARTRFIPTFEKIACQMGRTIQAPNVFCGHPARLPRLLPRHGDPTFEDSAKYYAAMNLEYYEVLEIHRSFPWWMMRGTEQLNLVVLSRDPRDMCVSETMFHQSHAGGTLDVPAAMTRWLELWAPQIARDFVRAAEVGAHLHRFESLQSDERGAWRDLLRRLSWSDFIDDESLDAAIYLGSFEHQSGGKVKRGEQDVARSYAAGQPEVRKGISGDWRNHFTQAHRDLCKNLIGQELIQLGYEDSLDW